MKGRLVAAALTASSPRFIVPLPTRRAIATMSDLPGKGAANNFEKTIVNGRDVFTALASVRPRTEHQTNYDVSLREIGFPSSSFIRAYF